MKARAKKKALAKKPAVKLRTPRAVGKGKITSVRSIRQMERRFKILGLRREGYTIKEISDVLGISPLTVSEDLKHVIKALTVDMGETVEESRAIQIARLDALIKKYQPLAEAGNLSAAGMVLSVEARRSKLLALDTPEQRKKEETGVREYIGVNVDDV